MNEEKHKDIMDAVAAAKLDTLLGDMGEVKDSIKELTRAVSRMALVEERQANTADSLGRAFKELEKHDARIKSLELAEPIQKQSSDIVQQVVKMIIAAVAGAIIGMAVINPGRGGPVVTFPTQNQK